MSSANAEKPGEASDPRAPKEEASLPAPECWLLPILRLYGPLPSFFDKSWRPSEIELVQ